MPPNRQAILQILPVIGLCLAAVGGFYRLSIAPLQQRERAAQRTIAELHERIETANKAIREGEALEKESEPAKAELKRLQNQQPVESAHAWFPEQLSQHFFTYGISVAGSRLGTVSVESGLPDYKLMHWAVDLQIEDGNRNVSRMLVALSELEKRHPLMKVLDFAIQPDPKNPGSRTATVNITALAPI